MRYLVPFLSGYPRVQLSLFPFVIDTSKTWNVESFVLEHRLGMSCPPVVSKKRPAPQSEHTQQQAKKRKLASHTSISHSTPLTSREFLKYKNPMEFLNHLFGGAIPKFSFETVVDAKTRLPSFRVLFFSVVLHFVIGKILSAKFQAEITVEGVKYDGWGSNKKDAKQCCAAEFIKFTQSPEAADHVCQTLAVILRMDWSSVACFCSSCCFFTRTLRHLKAEWFRL